MLTTHRFDDPAAFRDAVEEFLLRDEPRHNLILGILTTLIELPDAYDAFSLWSVSDADGATVAAALRTPPYLVAVSSPASDDALNALAAELAREPDPIPGVIGGLPEAREFARLCASASGRSIGGGMEQGVYVLESVADIARPRGAMRIAGPADIDLVLAWWQAFHDEAGPNDAWDEAQVRRRIENRLEGRNGEGVRLWEDGGAVSLAGFAGPTRTGMRVGPVYTPPELRGRGYATGLVADVSQELLDAGRAFCFLYTDAANPTSNAIYQRIGYRLHCGSAMIRFE